MEGELRWYAARAKPGQERLALENLSRQEFTAYYPRIHIERFKKGKIIKEVEGLFPGYLFVNVALDPAAWRTINSTRGIMRLLSFSQDGRPSPVPPGHIEALREREISGEFLIPMAARFRKNDTVRIKNGPSAGKTGRVLATKGERVEFLFNLLGREVKCIAPQHILYLVGKGDSIPVR
jgi:transcriptional antiterminator RfaH